MTRSSLAKILLAALSAVLPSAAATVDTLLITRSRPADYAACTRNPAVTSVSTLDSAVYAAATYSRGAGETLEFQWIAPDGSVHWRSSGTLQYTSGCQWSTLNLSSSISRLGGTWTVRVVLNGSLVRNASFTLIEHSRRKPRVVTSAIITRNPDTEGCTPPEPVNSFTEHDSALALWYVFENGYAGQVTTISWYNPSGGLEGTTRTSGLPSDGAYCSSSRWRLDERTSRMFGNWKAVATYDGQSFFELTVPLNDSRVVDVPYELRINQFLSGSCPQYRILASVRDLVNNSISGLADQDFVLTEDDGQQTPVSVTSAKSSAGDLSVAFVIDSSGSLGDSGLALEKAASRQLISLLDGNDAVGVWSFADDVTRQTDFTTDRDANRAAVQRIDAGGSTALFKAVVEAAGAIRNRGTRRAIVVLTDGEDTVGGETLDSAVQAARAANAPLFTIGFGGSRAEVLKQMADQTGGIYSASATDADLQRILYALGKAITGQYEVTYTSRNPWGEQRVILQVKARGGESNTHTIFGIPACTP